MLLDTGKRIWLFELGDIAVYKDGTNEVIADRQWESAGVLEVRINWRWHDKHGWSPNNPITQIITKGEMLST